MPPMQPVAIECNAASQQPQIRIARGSAALPLDSSIVNFSGQFKGRS